MRTGGCLCGAVRFEAARLGDFGVCHCTQCQRWAGGAFLGVNVPEDAMQLPERAPVVTFRSSARASRSHCGTCGSPLWYRHDRGADGTGDYEVAIGLFDDGNGLELKSEIFIDRKPDSFALAGDHARLTEAETLARHGGDSEGA
ncbi:GFA family protein [Histidinibacterium lentulum]|uniref:GFA family protein n=1 Tax=Histidinibacterium lentulum TaxID=2480588 RepID=A0A3N2R6B2_9RHOB|nr:GFA family protein [Histidinibacterium lentulum]ROU03009.1 GFA family protein [Histidinibacterium lentulum]